MDDSTAEEYSSEESITGFGEDDSTLGNANASAVEDGASFNGTDTEFVDNDATWVGADATFVDADSGFGDGDTTFGGDGSDTEFVDIAATFSGDDSGFCVDDATTVEGTRISENKISSSLLRYSSLKFYAYSRRKYYCYHQNAK